MILSTRYRFLRIAFSQGFLSSQFIITSNAASFASSGVLYLRSE